MIILTNLALVNIIILGYKKENMIRSSLERRQCNKSFLENAFGLLISCTYLLNNKIILSSTKFFYFFYFLIYFFYMGFYFDIESKMIVFSLWWVSLIILQYVVLKYELES